MLHNGCKPPKNPFSFYILHVKSSTKVSNCSNFRYVIKHQSKNVFFFFVQVSQNGFVPQRSPTRNGVSAVKVLSKTIIIILKQLWKREREWDREKECRCLPLLRLNWKCDGHDTCGHNGCDHLCKVGTEKQRGENTLRAVEEKNSFQSVTSFCGALGDRTRMSRALNPNPCELASHRCRTNAALLTKWRSPWGRVFWHYHPHQKWEEVRNMLLQEITIW